MIHDYFLVFFLIHRKINNENLFLEVHMKFIKIALIIAFSFISLQGIAPSIKNLCTIKQTHTIKKQGFNRDESEYIDLGNKYFYLTDNKHFTIE